MLVERIFIDNPLRNFHYLVACPDTGRALAIDPLEVDAVLAVAADRGWTVDSVLITHEHWDHAGGREAMVQATGASVAAHADAPLEGIDRRLAGGDVVRVGSSVSLAVLDTPGHTRSHVCLLGHGRLFSGDTLFVSGCGNCKHGGEPHALYETFSQQLWSLPDDVVVEPGHDYAVNNLRFALDREPGNQAARDALAAAERRAAEGGSLVTTIADERTFNPFFRLDRPEVRERVGLGDQASERDVFVALRDLRNRW